MSYLGSKAASGVYQKIIAEMPPHDTYIETHLGGGAVMLRKSMLTGKHLKISHIIIIAFTLIWLGLTRWTI